MSDPPRPVSCGSPARSPGRLKAVLAIYALAAALLPLSHHDVICHAKSTTHCSTCVIGSSGESAADSTSLLRLDLADAGTASYSYSTLPVLRVLTTSPGRAPPAAL
jgi:hypothetical protein